MTLSPSRPLPPKLAAVLLSSSLTVLAVAGASLVGEAVFPRLAGVEAGQVRLAVVVTAALVALPIILSLVNVVIRAREERRNLASREGLLMAAQQYARIGYWEYDVAAGRFVLPELVHRLLGDPEGRLEVTVPVLLGMTHPDDRDRLAAALGRVVEEGSHEQLEYRLTGLDGQEKTFWVNGAPLFGSGGRPVKVFGLFKDITERKATEAALRESEDHYRHMVELNPQIPWTADPQGGALEISGRWLTLTGMTPDEALGQGWVRVVHPDDVPAIARAFEVSMVSGEPLDHACRLRLATGEYRWFRARAAARRDAEGRVLRWYGTVEDIHDGKLADLQLRASEAFASSILENTTDGIEVIALDGRVEYINQPGRRLYEVDDLDYSLEDDWTAIWPEDIRPRAAEALASARAGSAGSFVGFCATAKGNPKWWDVSVSSIPGPDGRPARLLAVSRDITVQRLAQEELEYLAHHDSLTGLLSRPYFRELLEQELARSPADGRTALLVLDLDEFKSVNDSLGHPAGDQLLREAARRLRACLRPTDAIARFGGDEFAILQKDVEGTGQVEELARHIIECLSAPYRLEDQEVVAGASVGIALSEELSASADDLLKRADIALYRAKADGGGVFRFSEPGMETEAEERQRLRNELRDAVQRGELRLAFQPIVEFATSRVKGFEALVRWQHPRRGLLLPGEFISLAEATGAIEPLGDWVMQEACRAAAAWPQEISVSVNLSPRQFRGPCLADTVARALGSSGLAAGRLQLEITESVLLQDDEAVRATLASVRALGVRLSIDDFGIGYSSLGYLRRFAVDNIKIDQSFVADLSSNPRTAAILGAVMALGAELGVTITAEGVETAAQMARLETLGCQLGQGYLFARPMPEGEVTVFLRGSQRREWVLSSPHAERPQGRGDPRVLH